MNQLNILVIVMDTARADYVSQPEIMPNLHRFAEGGTHYTQCFANAPWTLPSHSSIFTGKRPTDHDVVGKGDIFSADVDIASMLTRAGYTTAAFSNNPWISPDFGFDSFDEFFACWKRFQRGSDLAGVSQREKTVDQLKALVGELLARDAPFTLANALYMRFFQQSGDSGARRTTRWLTNWIEAQKDNESFFAFVNYMEPHLEYTPRKSYAEEFLPSGVSFSEAQEVNQDPWAYLVGETPMDERDFAILRALYRAELSYLDESFGKILTHLSNHNLLNNTAVFVLGNHGENIGDHGLMDHQYSLRDTLLHVPLIARYPPVFASTTVREIVELRDLYPTILRIADATPPSDEEISMQSFNSVDSEHGREYAIAEYPVPQPRIDALHNRYEQITTDLSEYDRQIQSIRTSEWRYIRYSDGECELYEITEPGEDNKPRSPDFADVDFDAILREEVGPFPNREETTHRDLSPANQEQLEDLGYI